MQDGFLAELPSLTSSWRITFDLKLTKQPSRCCSRCANGIFHVKGGNHPGLDLNVLKISYQCANARQNNAPGLVLVFMGGRVFQRFRRKELLLGEWSSFKISQATENYNKKKRLMFKVNIIECINRVLTYSLLVKTELF